MLGQIIVIINSHRPIQTPISWTKQTLSSALMVLLLMLLLMLLLCMVYMNRLEILAWFAAIRRDRTILVMDIRN